MEQPPKNQESKKVFELPGGQKLEQEMDPPTGEVLSIAKKDAAGKTVEFYDLTREDFATAYDEYEKSLSRPRGVPIRKKTPAAPKKPEYWKNYSKIINPATGTEIRSYYNPDTQQTLELMYDQEGQVLRYTKREADDTIINFEDRSARTPSELQAMLDKAREDTQYFKRLGQLGWKPTEQ